MAIRFFNDKAVVDFIFLPTRFGFFKTVKDLGLTTAKNNN